MKHLLRPYRNAALVVLAVAGAAIVAAPNGARAQGNEIVQILQEPGPFLLHSSSSQGYLGVLVGDVDKESAEKLRLKDVRGAVITLIDHDAPASSAGLKVNDVVLQLNGQPVEGAEQLRRMLHEIPAGHNVSLVISRDGNTQTLAVQLADRKIVEQNAWKRIGDSGITSPNGPAMGLLGGGGDTPDTGSFHWWTMGSSLRVGALVEPLTAQMAEYLGVPSGLMVKSVAHKSAASAAGLKPFDVIVKVGNDAIATTSDWERSLHANEGKTVQVTILRDRKQQILTMQVDSKHPQTELQFESIFPAGEPLLAQAGEFQIDPRAIDELNRQMEQFKRDFPKTFKIAPRSLDELRRQMEELKNLPQPCLD